MAEPDRLVGDIRQALATLDTHFGMALGCPPADLRRSGWHVLVARHTMDDPTALLFGRRQLLQLVSPLPETTGAARGGVALVTPELRLPVSLLLRELRPELLFTADGLLALEALMQRNTAADLFPLEVAHLRQWYTLTGAFRPYLGPWLDWIEPLDDGQEMDPAALRLLARFSAGVFVIRDQDAAIQSFAGLRSQSPHVWEITAAAESSPQEGLARAVIGRATKAVLATNRLPLYSHAARDGDLAQVASELGYRCYGDTLTWSASA
ncbi:MAG TPA: hypothetical protein VFW76_04495 [Ktedonobacterales bacterium]|nr:hypothetical protein [Ktedonobacterales bacterium]